MSGINRVNMNSEGDGAVGKPEYEESHLQASDRLEQVSEQAKGTGLFSSNPNRASRHCSCYIISLSAMSSTAKLS